MQRMPAEDGPRGLTRAPQEKERVSKRVARFAHRPLVTFFLLSRQRLARMCHVSPRVGRLRYRERVLSVKLRFRVRAGHVSPPTGQVREGPS